MLAGLLEGLLDGMQSHPDNYNWLTKHNPQFWDTRLSWKNKYKNGDKTQGPRFWKSTTWLVFVTDGWHLLQFIMLTIITLIPVSLLSNNITEWLMYFIILRIMLTFFSTILYK